MLIEKCNGATADLHAFKQQMLASYAALIMLFSLSSYHV